MKKWLDSFYILARLSSELYATDKRNCIPQYMICQTKIIKKMKKYANQQSWKRLIMKRKVIVYRCRIFSLHLTFKLNFTEKYQSWLQMSICVVLNEWIVPENHVVSHQESIFRRGVHFSRFFFCKISWNRIAPKLLIKWTTHIFD